MNIVNVIPCNVYGIGDNFNLESSQLDPRLDTQVPFGKKNNTIFDVWGDGLAQREFLYNKDLGKIIDWMLLEYDSSESLIVSPDMEHAIVEAVVLITKAFDFSVVYDSSKPKGQHRKPSDNSKFKELRPDFEFTPLNTGIKETVDWFTKTMEILENEVMETNEQCHHTETKTCECQSFC